MKVTDADGTRNQPNGRRPDESEDRDGEFLHLMSQVVPGWTVAIDRVLPRWCDGHLETLRCNPKEPISLEMIKELFGGRMLHVTVRDDCGQYRGSRTIKFPSAPKDGDGNELIQPRPDNAPAAPVQNNHEQLAVMAKMFETMMEQTRNQTTQIVAIMDKRIDSVEKAAAAAAAAAPRDEYEPEPQQNPLDNIRQLAETMRELEGLRSEMAARGPDAAGGGAESGIMDTMVKEFFSLQLEKEKAKIQGMKQKHSGAPPPLPERRTAPVQPTAPAAPPPPVVVVERKDENEDRANNPRLRDLSDEDLARYVHQRLTEMDPRKMNEIFSIFAAGDVRRPDAPPPTDDGEDLDDDQADDGDDLDDDGANDPQVDAVNVADIQSIPRANHAEKHARRAKQRP